MPITVKRAGDVAILKLGSRLALGRELDEFRSKWSEALSGGAKNLVIDMTDVPSVDSSGIGGLIRCHSAVNAGGGKIGLAGATDLVRQAFRVTHLDRLFEFYDSEESAVQSLNP